MLCFKMWTRATRTVRRAHTFASKDFLFFSGNLKFIILIGACFDIDWVSFMIFWIRIIQNFNFRDYGIESCLFRFWSWFLNCTISIGLYTNCLFTFVSFATKRLVVIAFWVWGWGWIEIVIWPLVWIGVDTGEMLCDDVGESDPAPESWYSFD